MSKPRKIKPITPERLENAALHYLGRYASSAENLRRVLMRKVRRAVSAGLGDMESGAAVVAKIVDKQVRAGLLNDAIYAEGRAVALHRSGAPLSRIRQALKVKGVGGEEIDSALERLGVEGSASKTELDETAAFSFARRRRLGPYRPAEARAEYRQKDMATLGRAGFSYEIARNVIDSSVD